MTFLSPDDSAAEASPLDAEAVEEDALSEEAQAAIEKHSANASRNNVTRFRIDVCCFIVFSSCFLIYEKADAISDTDFRELHNPWLWADFMEWADDLENDGVEKAFGFKMWISPEFFVS